MSMKVAIENELKMLECDLARASASEQMDREAFERSQRRLEEASSVRNVAKQAVLCWHYEDNAIRHGSIKYRVMRLIRLLQHSIVGQPVRLSDVTCIGDTAKRRIAVGIRADTEEIRPMAIFPTGFVDQHGRWHETREPTPETEESKRIRQQQFDEASKRR